MTTLTNAGPLAASTTAAVRTSFENFALASIGYFAPANLNYSVGDPLAGLRPNIAAVPFVVVREALDNFQLPGDDRELTPEGQPFSASGLGWSKHFTEKIRTSLASFDADWNDPAMDVYDSE